MYNDRSGKFIDETTGNVCDECGVMQDGLTFAKFEWVGKPGFVWWVCGLECFGNMMDWLVSERKSLEAKNCS